MVMPTGKAGTATLTDSGLLEDFSPKARQPGPLDNRARSLRERDVTLTPG